MTPNILTNALIQLGNVWIRAQGGQIIEAKEGNVVHTTRELASLARATGKPASAIFNDIRITADPNDYPKDVYERYLSYATGTAPLERTIADAIINHASEGPPGRRR